MPLGPGTSLLVGNSPNKQTDSVAEKNRVKQVAMAVVFLWQLDPLVRPTEYGSFVASCSNRGSHVEAQETPAQRNEGLGSTFLEQDEFALCEALFVVLCHLHLVSVFHLYFATLPQVSDPGCMLYVCQRCVP